MMQEKSLKSFPGIPVLLLAFLLLVVGAALMVFFFSRANATNDTIWIVSGIVTLVLTPLVFLFLLTGLYKVEPNQSVVLSLFGRYVGTNREQGLHFNNPFFTKKKVSLRVRNFESGQMKVNDLGGSPIEIASIVVWEVVDSAEAVFNVDDYQSFVQIQSEAAIRAMASNYHYDPAKDGDVSLRSHPVEVSDRMKAEIQDRLQKAGIKVIEARISHLAYAPEIAQAMLQRQQAGAIIAARRLIVDGAVGMVEAALDNLKEKGVVELDEERRAAMVSNLLVVLCSDKATQPVVNTGSIY